MKKVLITFLLLGISGSFVFSQAQILEGFVQDKETKEGLYGVNVYLPAKKEGVVTDEKGYFKLKSPGIGSTIRFSFVGYETVEIIFQGQNDINVSLKPAINLEEIVIKSIRAGEYAPVAKAMVNREKIEKIHVGQDALFMLESTTPSLITYSEAGTSFSNYGQFRLRGIDQSRVNITLNGAPLNDMIDQGVFFSNFTDFSNSIQSAQVQRGVGTSTNGTASFAGSINFESVNLLGDKPSGDVELVGGSFNTYRGSVGLKTGLLKNKTAFYSRFSTFKTDGSRYHTGTNAYSFYASGGYFGERDLIKITGFIGRSKNGLAYSPVAISDIRVDPKTNYINENDIDDFGQGFLQAQHTHLFTDYASLVSSIYYGGAGGDFPWSYYDDSGTLIQINYPLTNDHIGIMSNINASTRNEKLNISAGVHAYAFLRTNLESIVPDNKNPYYVEHSKKDEISFFSKAEYIIGKTRLFADLQFRTLQLAIDPDNTLLPDEGVVLKKWTFLNPRIGINYSFNETKQLYASFGSTGREPTKIDLFGGFNLNPSNLESVKSNDIKPEYVNDIEAGMNFSYPKFKGQVNVYYMMFKDEIAPIGEYVPEGFLQLRKNVPRSFRRGVELDFTWDLINNLSLSGNFTYMDSEIKEYDPVEDPNVYNNVRPALSPEIITKAEFRYQAISWLSFSLSGRYVSESYQEPTNNELFIMPAFFVSNLNASIHFGDGHSLDFFLNNIFDQQYFTYGAPVDVDWDGIFDEPGYFVEPPRNFYVRLIFKF